MESFHIRRIDDPINIQRTAELAAYRGDLQRLRWLQSRGVDLRNPTIANAASRSLDLATWQWFRSIGSPLDYPYMRIVANHEDDAEARRWLNSLGY